MKARELLKSSIPKFILRRIKNIFYNQINIEPFEFKSKNPRDINKDIQEKYGGNGDLADIFSNNKDFLVHKWHHYIPIYERYFAPFRGKKIRFLEIGVSEGGSLQMWRKYFGNDAVIFGIDINPKCIKFDNVAGKVRIGSQEDEKFLEEVVKEMGGLDIVLDDGSHHMKHITSSLKCLFPHLNYNGIYMIEDLHTSYWKIFGGGYNTKSNFFRFLNSITDDMHHWYHSKGLTQAGISRNCSGIHIHDSIVVLEKNKVYEPVHSQNP